MTFALVRFEQVQEHGESARIGLVNGDLVRSLPDDEDRRDDINEILAHYADLKPTLDYFAADEHAAWRPLSEVRLLAPVKPRQIIQVGMNSRSDALDARQQVAEPYMFTALPTVIGAPSADVMLPTSGERTFDCELVIGAVIGKEAYRVTAEDALDHVAGWTIVNDITSRNLVFTALDAMGTDWFQAKNSPGFLPTGPHLVPREFAPEPWAMRVLMRVNGEVVQDDSAKDMIFTCPELVAHASQTTRLLPGDLVTVGSPTSKGVREGLTLTPGDVMEGEITGLGRQTVRCVDEPPGMGPEVRF